MKLVRESLFSSAVRSFCISFFAVIGIVIAVFIILLAFGAGKTAKSSEASNFEMIIPDTNGRKYVMSSQKPLLLRIDINGVIGSGGMQGISAENIRAILNESQAGALKNGLVKGILLYINSPGGGATTSESIYEALKQYSLKYQIPIYAYVEGLCASGGMYIACAADKIYATETSVIGSVGVIGMFFNYSDGMGKIGIQNKTLTAGTGKDDLNPYKPWQENSGNSMQHIIDLNYKQFISVVSKERPKLTEKQLINKYGANVYYATEAEQYGYIDGAGYQLQEVAQMLAKSAGITDNKFQVIQLEPKVRFTDFLSLKNSLVANPSLMDLIKKNPFSFLSPINGELMNLYTPAPDSL